MKIQLHRARLQLKKQLEAKQRLPIKQQDVNAMLKQQLKEAALQFFTIPASYELCIDDVNDEKAIFLWKESMTEEGFYIEFDQQGKLLSLSQPASNTVERKPIDELKQIATHFLTKQYPEALHFFTLTQEINQEDRVRFKFEQLVGGIPLDSHYCFIEVAYDGQIVDFNFRGYVKNPPTVPNELAQTEMILAKLLNADWTPRLSYVSSDLYTVPTSGLYVVYESPFLYHVFDAVTGVDLYGQDDEETEELETYVAFPEVEASPPLQTIEDIIGITPSLEIIRQAEIDDDKQGIVWREKNFTARTDKSMNSFIADRFEQTVKATVQTSTNELKGFIWFKERTGDLQLSFEQCQHIAASFVKTYYGEYVPFLQMQVQKPSFNELHRACFTFPIVVDGFCLGSESFVLTVNQTTGYVDMLMTPHIGSETLKAYTPSQLLPLTEAKKSLNDVDALLQWYTDYTGEEPTERLIYTFAHRNTKQKIKGINASTGEIICMKY